MNKAAPLVILAAPSPWRSLGCAARRSAYVVLALVALWTAWYAYAARAIPAALAASRARGEPISVEDLNPVLPPGEANAADLCLAADAACHLSAAEEELINPTPMGSYFGYPLNEADLTAARRLLDSRKATLELVRRIRTVQHAAWIVDPDDWRVTGGNLRAVRHLALFLRAMAIVQHQNRHDNEAVETLRDLLILADRVGQGPAIIHTLMASIPATMASETVRDLAPDLEMQSATHPSGATPEQMRSLLGELLDTGPAQAQLVRAYRGEQAYLLVVAMKAIDQPAAVPMRPLLRLSVPRALQFIDAQAAAARAPNWPAVQARFPREPDRDDHLILAFTDFFLRRSIDTDRAILLPYRSRTDRVLAATRLGIREFELDHGGKIPAALAELSPIYLAAVPVDPFRADGGPISYVPARRVLYSVGENGRDDGGTLDSTIRPPGWGRAPDAVYPLDRWTPPPPPPPPTWGPGMPPPPGAPPGWSPVPPGSPPPVTPPPGTWSPR
jgi:hypothetical protein